MTAVADGFMPTQEQIKPANGEGTLGKMVDAAFVDAAAAVGEKALAEAATTLIEEEPQTEQPETLRPLPKAYTPVDDRFTHGNLARMSPEELQELRARESFPPQPTADETPESSGVLMSTYHARRFRAEASDLGNIVLRNNFLRRHGLL